MNRSNPFRFDLRNGIRFIAKKFLVLPLLVSLVCFEFMLRLRETASLNHQYAGAQPTLGDFAMYLFGGMKPYIPNPDEPFLFPVSWFLVFGICLFLTLYYPVYDRDTFGKMVIVYSGSRTKWWTAKCAWIIVATFLYFFLCWILLLINCLLYGGQFTLSVSPYMSDIFLLRETVPPDQWNVCHVLLLMPPLIASSFGILQILYDAALAWVLSALIGIPELLLLLCAGCRLLRLFRNKSLREVIGFGIALLLVCLLPTCLASLPGWMIPNQWGSMAAWHSLLSAAGDRLTEWFALCPTARDVQLKGEAAQVVVFTCGSLVFAVAACLSWGSSVKTKGKRSLCPYDNHATLNL